MPNPWLIFHGVGIATTAVLAYGTFVPRSQLWGKIHTHGDVCRPSVALTFDDGPTDGPTDHVLDILAAAGVKAAFFVIGRNCIKSPALVRRMHAEGHLIGNHTWDHFHLGVMGLQRFWDDQLRQTDDAIANILGVRPALFRPPIGHKTFHTARAAKKLGHRMVGWSRSAKDGLPTESASIVERLAETTGPGDIVLLHDGVEPHGRHRDPAATLTALPLLIARFKARGLNMVRVDELLGLDAYQQPAAVQAP